MTLTISLYNEYTVVFVKQVKCVERRGVVTSQKYLFGTIFSALFPTQVYHP